MSIPVTPAELGATAAARGAAYVITTGPDGRPHVSHLTVVVEGAVVRCTPGRSTLRNAGAGGPVVLLWPQDDDGYSLIADGTGSAGPDGALAVAVDRAVLHRPAPPSSPAPADR